MRAIACVLLLIWVPASALGLGENQLYVGDPSTVKPGLTQLQLYTDATYPARARLGGMSLRRGLTTNTDLKLAYSYLWNFSGPDASLGPNIGLKWRFAGDGRMKPSLAVSALCVLNQESGGRAHKSDYGASLIGSCPTPVGVVLANYGHVWVGDNIPDLRYVGLALVRPVAKRTLVALEYSDFERVRNSGPNPPKRQIAAGMIYKGGSGWNYGLQVGYLPEGVKVKWHTTLGVATYF